LVRITIIWSQMHCLKISALSCQRMDGNKNTLVNKITVLMALPIVTKEYTFKKKTKRTFQMGIEEIWSRKSCMPRIIQTPEFNCMDLLTLTTWHARTNGQLWWEGCWFDWMNKAYNSVPDNIQQQWKWNQVLHVLSSLRDMGMPAWTGLE